MSQSLIERLNTLAVKQQEVSKTASLFPEKYFTEEFFSNRESGINKLQIQFSEIENDEDRVQWLKSIFIQLFQTIFIRVKENESIDFPLSDVSAFLNELAKVSPTHSNVPSSSIVGKMFIATSSSIPEVSQNETDLITIIKAASRIHTEVFKFSWLSGKLTTRPQTQLLRHLLKRSKYELKKFNLFTENSVGFSQLAMHFVTAYQDKDGIVKIQHYINETYHICGKYSMDPMRCLDLFLLVSAEYLTEGYHFLLQFLSKSDMLSQSGNKYNKITISNIIAFNLNSGIENSNYYDLCGLLVKYNFLDADLVWNNITPTTEILNKFIEKTECEIEEESMKGIDNPLAMAAALSNEDEDYPMDDEDHKATIDGSKLDSNNPGTLSKEHEAIQKEKIIINGKIPFLRSLLIHGNLRAAQKIILANPKCILIDEQLPKLVTRFLEYMIEPLMRNLSLSTPCHVNNALLISTSEGDLLSRKPRLLDENKTHNPFPVHELNCKFSFYFREWTNDIEQINSIDELFKQSHLFYTLLGPQLAANTLLLSKICRISNNQLKENPDSTEVTERWIDYFRKFLLPTIPLLGQNPVVANQIYALLRLFPFETRYFMYNEMITKLSQDIFFLRIEFNKAERDAKNILKALSTDTITKESRKLANLISSNPLATLISTVKQIENYDKVSELVIYATRYFNDFAYDVLQYILLLRLTQNRPSMQSDGINQAMWIQRLSIFVAGLAKKCPEMDISNIIIFIIKKLHEGSTIANSILNELLNTVSGIRDLNEVNMKSLIMLNSGEPLKRHARKLIFDTRDSKPELALKLISLFKKENSVSEIILLLYNLNLKANTEEGHYKILSTKCDNMNTLLWSFIELVKFSLISNDFTKNVLPFDTLSNDFEVSASWTFHIWRDYMDQKADLNKNNRNEAFDNVLEKTKFNAVDFEKLSRPLFINFWKYSLYDIHFDKSLYDEHKESLENEKSNTDLSSKRKHSISSELKETLLTCISHQKTFNNTKSLLTEQSQSWCNNITDEEIKAFLQYCLIPRILFSPPDAIYSNYFMLQAFPMEIIMKIYDILIRSKILIELLFSSTISEAGNVGIFFTTFLDSFEEMRTDEDFPESYRRQIFEWHTSINNQIIDLINETNYMSIRNGIEFMKHVSSVFPVIDSHIKLLSNVLQHKLKIEEREDIKLPTNALIGHLNARLKKESIKLEDFCQLNEEESEIKAKKDKELEEIKTYESQIANEQKQIELRKQLELNKKKREEGLTSAESVETIETVTDEAKDKDDIYNSNSHDTDYTWPFPKVVRYMEDVAYDLKKNDLSRIISYIGDNSAISGLKEVLQKEMPIREFRSSVYNIIENFFLSLIYNPKNPEFRRNMDAIRSTTSYISPKMRESNGDMYSENDTGAGKKASRFNGDSNNIANKNEDTPTLRAYERKGVSDTRASIGTFKRSGSEPERSNRHDSTQERGSSRFSNNNPDRNRSSSNRSAPPQRTFGNKSTYKSDNIRIPEKPSSQDSSRLQPRGPARSPANKEDSRGYKRELPSGPDDRSNKRYKQDSGEYRRQPQYQDTRGSRDSRDNRDHGSSSERSRFNGSSNQSNKRPNKENTGSRQSLPQGPKGSGNYNSRYQR